MTLFGTSIAYIVRDILKVFGISISVVLSLFIVKNTYTYGFVTGYNQGSLETESYFAAMPGIISDASVVLKKPTTTPTKPPSNPSIPSSTISSNLLRNVSWGGTQLWEVVNQKRKSYGVNALSVGEDLCTIASIRLNELLELGKLDGHEGFSTMEEKRPDLKHIFENYSAMAEFLAAGAQTPEETVSLWENSLGHKQLLTGGEYVWGCIYAQNSFAVAITAY